MHLRHLLLLSSLLKQKRKSEREIIIKFHFFQPLLLGSWELSQLILTKVPCGRGHLLLQGIFPAQESNPGLLHCRQILYRLSYEGRLFTDNSLSNEFQGSGNTSLITVGKTDQVNSVSKLYSLYLGRANSRKTSRALHLGNTEQIMLLFAFCFE